MKIHTMTLSEERLYNFAKRWREAAHNEAVGMGSASPAIGDAHDLARNDFVRALAGASPKMVAALVLEAIDSRWREVAP